MARKKKSGANWLSGAKYELYGMMIIILSIITLAEWGAVGRSLRYILRFIVGTWDFFIPLFFIGFALYGMVKRSWPKRLTLKTLGGLLLLLSLLILSHIQLFPQLTNDGELKINIIKETFHVIWEERQSDVPLPIGGGLVGAIFFMLLYYLFGLLGSKITAYFLLFVSIMFITGITMERIYKKIGSISRKVWLAIGYKAREIRSLLTVQRKKRKESMQKVKNRVYGTKQMEVEDEEEDLEEKHVMQKGEKDTRLTPVIHDFTQKAYQEESRDYLAEEQRNLELQQQNQQQMQLQQNQQVRQKMTDLVDQEQVDLGDKVDLEIMTEMPEYKLPSYNLLDRAKKNSKREYRDITNNATKLEQTLKSFGVQARVTQIHRGPAVTQYEVQPDIGVKVSRIVSLSDDLALALAAKDIRIEAPIPGKSAIGIEVPNSEISIVTLREVLESSLFHEATSKLTLALGRDISGEPIVGDLAKMPHLLVAGATGSGKSVCINGLIASVLYKAKPDEVKFLMIDPKMVELSIYNGIPHLLAPVVTDPRKASVALRKVVMEMEKRYESFSKVGAKDIERYNQILTSKKGGDKQENPIPYIIVIVDELADLMMVSPADVEDSITRLAQKARAAGIHLILATQRPSVDVITGVIKANIPSRIAFGVSSQVDSRTILDMAGAEKLLGKGDMLYLPVGSSKVTRIQGCFVSDREIEAIVKFVKVQQEAQYHEDLISDELPEEHVEPIEDEYYEKAVELVIESQTASVSLLQRRFRIGYARAARLIDVMEQKGIVGPYEGSKPRTVLVSKQDSQIS